MAMIRAFKINLSLCGSTVCHLKNFLKIVMPDFFSIAISQCFHVAIKTCKGCVKNKESFEGPDPFQSTKHHEEPNQMLFLQLMKPTDITVFIFLSIQ